MPEFGVLGIDHITVTVPLELEAEVVDWYARLLGLQRLTKPEGTRPSGAWFAAGNHEVHVTIDPHNPPRTAHFALIVDRFAVAVDALRSAGCHIEQAMPIAGRQHCYTRDPAGNRIEILSFDDSEGRA